jgi:Skp family chaperone for outer membrane proteins
MQETFGQDGIIESKSAERLAPLYEKLTVAADKVAKEMGLDLILDLEQTNPLFVSDRLDVTDEVLAEFKKFW